MRLLDLLRGSGRLAKRFAKASITEILELILWLLSFLDVIHLDKVIDVATKLRDAKKAADFAVADLAVKDQAPPE